VNTGDILEAWMNGMLPATRHRVVVPEMEARRRCHRQSIAFFVHPEDDVIVENVVGGKDGKDWYKPTTARQFLLKRFAATYYT